MKDFAKSIRTINSNKEEIIKKKKEAGATLKVDNGQKLEFSDGTTYVKTSFSDDYREAHNYVGNDFVSKTSLQNALREQEQLLKDAEKMLKSKLDSDEKIEWQMAKEDAKKKIERIKEKLSKIGNAMNKKVGNSKVGNSDIYSGNYVVISDDGDVWFREEHDDVPFNRIDSWVKERVRAYKAEIEELEKGLEEAKKFMAGRK